MRGAEGAAARSELEIYSGVSGDRAPNASQQSHENVHSGQPKSPERGDATDVSVDMSAQPPIQSPALLLSQETGNCAGTAAGMSPTPVSVRAHGAQGVPVH